MNVKFQDSEVKEDQAFTFTEEEKGTHEEGYWHPQIVLTNELDPHLLENFDTKRGVLVVRVLKDQVIAGDIMPVLYTLKQLIASPKIARSFKEKVDIQFDGYDHDPRELYQIPEVRAYIRKLDAEFPYWLYFLSKHFLGLHAILACLLPTYWQELTEVNILNKKVNKIVERWKPAIKQIIDFAGLSYGLRDEIIASSLNYFSCPTDFIYS